MSRAVKEKNNLQWSPCAFLLSFFLFLFFLYKLSLPIYFDREANVISSFGDKLENVRRRYLRVQHKSNAPLPVWLYLRKLWFKWPRIWRKKTLDDKAALSAHDRWLNPFSGASDGLIKAATGRYICVGGVREAATPAYSQIIYATSLWRRL